jgi:hypothetical protein
VPLVVMTDVVCSKLETPNRWSCSLVEDPPSLGSILASERCERGGRASGGRGTEERGGVSRARYGGASREREREQVEREREQEREQRPQSESESENKSEWSESEWSESKRERPRIERNAGYGAFPRTRPCALHRSHTSPRPRVALYARRQGTTRSVETCRPTS